MKTTTDANAPRCWEQLAPDQQAALVGWIRGVLVPAHRAFHRTSYGMKHDFEREPGGFYVTNGMFKGAMLAAGHQPVDASEINWRFRVKPIRELDEQEKDELRVIGRGWLLRDGPHRGGYIVVNRKKRERIDAWCRTCAREKRPAIRVEVRGHTAMVVMDMITADWKLSPDAVDEVRRLFASIDPKGRNWGNVNECYNYIQRVPLYKAEEIAPALVRIANGCRLTAILGPSRA